MVCLSLLLSVAIQAAQPTISPAAAKTPTPVEIPRTEMRKHMPTDRPLLFLRVKTNEHMFLESIEVQVTVDREGNVIAAKASRDRDSRLNLPPQIYDQAEAMVSELHFKPFERGGKPLIAAFNFDVSLLPPELKPASHVPFPKVKDWKTLKIRLQRSGCYLTCSSYTIEVHDDGTVVYTGDAYVAFTGNHRGTVPADNVLELVQLFERADYFSLRDKYYASVTDLPTYTTAIEFDGQRKRVVDNAGLQIGMPMSVPELENAIDRLADSARWIAGNSNTLTSLQKEHWDFNSQKAADTLARVAERGNAEVVRDLVLAGVPVNSTGEGGSALSALEVAAYRGNVPMLRALLAAGANPGTLARATVRAAESGKIDALRLMLDAGGDIGSRDANGRTVLIAAAASGSPEMVRQVLKEKAEINAIATPPPPNCEPKEKYEVNCEELGGYGRTALMEAVSQYESDVPAEGVDRAEAVRVLLAAGADVNARDKAGNTALILCRCNADEVLLLLQAGVDPNARNHVGATALGEAYDDAVKAILLKHGAVPTAKEAIDK